MSATRQALGTGTGTRRGRSIGKAAAAAAKLTSMTTRKLFD